MNRMMAFIKKWLFVPLLPFFVLWVAARLEDWALGRSIAVMLRDNPTPEYVTDVNRTLAAAALAFVLLAFETLASLLDDARKVQVKTSFQPANGFQDRSYIGRLEEDSTLIHLTVETECPRRSVRWFLRLLVPDLAIELSWMKDWLRVTTDTTDSPTPLVFTRQADYDAGRISLFAILGQQGKAKEEFPLYIAPTSNRRKEGQLSTILTSRHRVGFFLANLLLLRATLKPIQLYLRSASQADPKEEELLARIASADPADAPKP